MATSSECSQSHNRIRTLKDAMSSKTPENEKFMRWIPVRGDGRFAVQHYVLVFAEKDNKDIGDLIQLQPNRIHTTIILKADVVNSEYAIDEMNGRLYLIKSFISYAKVYLYSLSLAHPDASGFRKASLTGGDAPDLFFKFDFGPEGCNALAPLMIRHDGNLVWWVEVDVINTSKPERDTLRHRMAAISPDQQKATLFEIFQMSHYPFHQFAIIKQNTQLVVHCHPQKFTPRRMDRSLFVTFDIEYGESVRVIGPIDRIQPCAIDLLERPLRSFKDVFAKKAQLIGQGYKYWFVGFVKDTSQKLLAVRSQHLSLDCLKDKQPRQFIWPVQKYSAYKVAMGKLMFDLMGKEVELMNAWVNKGMYHAHFGVGTHSRLLISVPLPIEFKDYRVCANCKRQENGKRKDSKGKRTAAFKVCGICKSLKMHLRWCKFGCHFCSKQCIDQLAYPILLGFKENLHFSAVDNL